MTEKWFEFKTEQVLQEQTLKKGSHYRIMFFHIKKFKPLNEFFYCSSILNNIISIKNNKYG